MWTCKSTWSSRRKPKDWCDIADVLVHNDAGGVAAVREFHAIITS